MKGDQVMESISVYAESATTAGEGDQVNVFLHHVDVSQVVKEFNATTVLEALDWNDIIEFVNTQRAEAEDE
jgi:hypothetical protein